ncbi:phasin family protein [Microvirga zambiensis]|uniref:phasin family protein n=1 Tax=Microvirga zambiensis TaxID=1402137 RepID=UPI0031B5ADAA
MKTRERLLTDLKEELELLASLQEQHLFPILTRHGMQDLVVDAVRDSEETNALLAELERMPKNSVGFLGQVAELRRTFQQHIRDDKKELLPAVLKVLSDEEVNEVIEKVEDEMATIDETKRAEARRLREQGETVQQVTDGVADTIRAGVEGAQTIARTMQETVETNLGTLSEITRRSTEHGLRIFGYPSGNPGDLSGRPSENFRAVTQAGTVLARGLQDVSREVFELSQKRLQRNVDGFNQLAGCRTAADMIAVHSSLFRDNLEQSIDNSRRLAELTIRVIDEATKNTAAQAQQTVQRFSRVA